MDARRELTGVYREAEGYIRWQIFKDFQARDTPEWFRRVRDDSHRQYEPAEVYLCDNGGQSPEDISPGLTGPGPTKLDAGIVKYL